MAFVPCLIRSMAGPELRAVRLGHPLLDDYLEFVAARARSNSLLAVAYDLKVFFSGIAKELGEVTTGDVLAFVKAQRAPRRGAKVVRLEDGEAGLGARTVKRRLASLSGLFAYLIARDDVGMVANPVPGGLAARRPGQRPGVQGVPLIRAPRTLPRVLEPAEVDAFLGALRTRRDRGWPRRWCWAVCDAARFSACVWAICVRASGGCSWPRARAAASASCPSPPVFSLLPPTACRPSVLPPRVPTGCSLCSRGHEQVSRCRRPAWTRSSQGPANARGSPVCHATSCAIPASPVCGKPGWRSRPSRPGRARLHRVDADLFAPGQRLAGW